MHCNRLHGPRCAKCITHTHNNFDTTTDFAKKSYIPYLIINLKWFTHSHFYLLAYFPTLICAPPFNPQALPLPPCTYLRAQSYPSMPALSSIACSAYVVKKIRRIDNAASLYLRS